MKNCDKLVIKNRTAVVIWIVTLIWITFSIFLVKLALTEPQQLGIWGQVVIYFVCIVGSIAITAHSLTQAIVHTIFDAGSKSVLVISRFINRVEKYNIPFREIDDIDIVVAADSDGDDYYHLTLFTKSGHRLTIKEGNNKKTIDKFLTESRSFLELCGLEFSNEDDDNFLDN